MNETETRHCSGCGLDKPLQQFQVIKENRDGTTWVKTRNWCLACCHELERKQQESDQAFGQVHEEDFNRRAARLSALGPLPSWCDADAFDYLVNGDDIGSLLVLANPGGTVHERRAMVMVRLWEEFSRHERAQGDPLGGRGGRFMQAMAGLLKEPEAKFRQKLRRMCKHDASLLGVFETAPASHRRSSRKIRAV